MQSLPFELVSIIAEYAAPQKYKIADCLYSTLCELELEGICQNRHIGIVDVLEQCVVRLTEKNWHDLIANPFAITFLKAHEDVIEELGLTSFLDYDRLQSEYDNFDMQEYLEENFDTDCLRCYGIPEDINDLEEGSDVRLGRYDHTGMANHYRVIELIKHGIVFLGMVKTKHMHYIYMNPYAFELDDEAMNRSYEETLESLTTL